MNASQKWAVGAIFFALSAQSQDTVAIKGLMRIMAALFFILMLFSKDVPE